MRTPDTAQAVQPAAPHSPQQIVCTCSVFCSLVRRDQTLLLNYSTLFMSTSTWRSPPGVYDLQVIF